MRDVGTVAVATKLFAMQGSGTGEVALIPPQTATKMAESTAKWVTPAAGPMPSLMTGPVLALTGAGTTTGTGLLSTPTVRLAETPHRERKAGCCMQTEVTVATPKLTYAATTVEEGKATEPTEELGNKEAGD